MSSDILLLLYKSLVRLTLEYCVQAWRPYLKKDIYLLEKDKRKATIMMVDLRGGKYEGRLKILD